MFNAIFGSMFSQQQKVDSTTEGEECSSNSISSNNNNRQSAEAETQTIGATRSSTSSSGNNNLRRSYSAVVAANLPGQAQQRKQSDQSDWVIVDPSEEADKLNKSTMVNNNNEEDEEVDDDDEAVAASNAMDETTEETTPLPQQQQSPTTIQQQPETYNDIMLGSFFDRAEQDVQRDEEASKQGAFIRSVYKNEPTKEWLITPLPCLASVSTTHVENGPLENLLIEQPCVFMTTASPLKQQQQSLMTTSTTSFPPLSQGQDVHMSSPVAALPRKMAMSFASIVKSTAEKRKERTVEVVVAVEEETKKPVVATAEVSPQQSESVSSSRTVSPLTVLEAKMTRAEQKKAKKAKKSHSGSPPLSRHNKENQAVKILLMCDLKKSLWLPPGIDSMNVGNCKQMKRNNRMAVLTCKQRKYHNLQQPVSFSNNSNNQF